MNLSQNKKVILAVAGALVLILTLIFVGIIPGLKSEKETEKRVSGELTFWGLFDRQEAYGEAFAAFKREYPNISISYRQFNDPQEYREKLVDALAAGTGPDIFMIHSNDLYQDSNKVSPLSKESSSKILLEKRFPRVVEADFAPQGIFYALPLSVDTLALIYNRALLNASGIPLPPENWTKFLEMVPKLTKLGAQKTIDISAAAIGGSTRTIDTATDVLNLLMLQSGTVMTSSDFIRATFASKEGVSAFSFYSQFGDKNKSTYTWSDTMPHYLDAFAREKVAMIFDYASALPQIRFRNNFLDIGISSAPQLAEAQPTALVSYPSYWGYTTSRQARRPDIVWNFIISLTTSPSSANAYLTATKRPPALLSLVDSYSNNPELGVFARQALIARSWPQVNRVEIRNIFDNAIQTVLGGKGITQTLTEAQNAVSGLMSKRLQ